MLKKFFGSGFLLGALLWSGCEVGRAVNLTDPSACDKDHEAREDYATLYNFLKDAGAHKFNESITIGFLGAYGQAQVVLGALPLAIDAVNKDDSKSMFLSLDT